jgi:hypothetical protein
MMTYPSNYASVSACPTKSSSRPTLAPPRDHSSLIPALSLAVMMMGGRR